MTNRFKGLDEVDRLPDEIYTEVCNTVQEAATKSSPKKKKCKKAKWLSEEALQTAEERRKTRRGKDTKLNAEFQGIARGNKKAFFSEQGKK